MGSTYDNSDDWPDEAEPEPDTIGAASGTAKCHHCGERIRSTVVGWVHIATDARPCDAPDDVALARAMGWLLGAIKMDHPGFLTDEAARIEHFAASDPSADDHTRAAAVIFRRWAETETGVH